jgi:secreted protein with Ig-like and vWFA domain
MPAGSQDLRQVYLQNPNHPPTTIVFGDANVYDRQQAQHMQDLPKVTLVKVADYAGHDVISELISAGHLEGLIQELLAPV